MSGADRVCSVPNVSLMIEQKFGGEGDCGDGRYEGRLRWLAFEASCIRGPRLLAAWVYRLR